MRHVLRRRTKLSGSPLPHRVFSAARRGVRLQLKYEKVEERLLAWAVPSTVVSTRRRDIVNFDRLILEGTITDEDLALFSFANTPEHAWQRIERHIVSGPPPHCEGI
jgi:hypothetical protein